MIYPRFMADSFWNFSEACQLVGARYPAIPLGLITVAAMLPNVPAMYELHFAVPMAGAVLNALNIRLDAPSSPSSLTMAAQRSSWSIRSFQP